MNNYILIILSINLTICAFIGAYYLIREHCSFRMQRSILMLIPIASTLVVLAKRGVGKSAVTFDFPMATLEIQKASNDFIAKQSFVLNLPQIYGIVCITFLVYLTFKVMKTFWFFKDAKWDKTHGVKLLETNLNNSFSFLNRVHLSNKISPDQRNIILEHELLHVNKKHSLDIILLSIYHSLFWINPLFFIVKKELKNVQEFEIDEAMYKVHKNKYATFLLEYSLGYTKSKNMMLANPFINKLSLLKRIKK